MSERTELNEIEVKQLAVIKRLAEDLTMMVDLLAPEKIRVCNHPEFVDTAVNWVRVANSELQKLKQSCVLP